MSVQEGLEPKAVRAAGERIESLGKQVSGIQDDGNAMLKVLAAVWEGPDLGTFESGWSEAGPQVAQAAETLRAAGAELRRQAEDQVRASDGEGSRGGGGGGWGWPDWDLPDFDFPDLNPFDGWDWDLPDIDWPDIDLGKLLSDFWDGFLDLLEGIGDWWDDIPWWGQLIIGVVAVIVIAVVLFFVGLEVAAIVAALGTIAMIVGAIMTVLDLLDEIAEFLRDPKAAIEKFLNDPLAALDDLIWLVVGALPWGIGKVLQRFRKPLKELFENAAPWLKRKWDDVAAWGKKKWDDAEGAIRRKYDEFLDWASARRNKKDLGGGLDVHEGRTTEGSKRGPGHVQRDHVGKSDQDMINRANGDKPVPTSSYPSNARAERAIADNVNEHEKQIQKWLKNAKPNESKSFDSQHDYPTGRHVPKGGTSASDVTGSRVVIVPDPKMPKGYRILTSHPIP